MRWLGWSMAMLVGCGPSVFVPDGAGDGTGTDGGDDESDGPGAEDQGGPDDGSDGDIDACATKPSIRAVRYYSGSALRTVGRDLVRSDDGTLFMAGSMADASNVGLWAAATTEEGDVLWELFGELEPGANLRSAPTFEDLAWQQDRLLYAGGGAGGSAVVGGSNQQGNYVSDVDPNLMGLYATSIASDSPLVTFVVGRTAGAAFVSRRDDDTLTWQINGLSADAITQANDTILVGTDLYVAGQRQDLPWLGRFDTDSAEETLSVVANNGTTFEPEGGELSALSLDGDRIVTVGSVRHNKPKPDGSPGAFIYNEAFARAWAPDGTPAWTWQPSATTIRPGSLFAVATDPDGTSYFAGHDGDTDGEDGPFVGAIDGSGNLVWSIPSEEFGPDLELFHATGLALGEPGRLFVLVSSNHLTEETTAIVEVCY